MDSSRELSIRQATLADENLVITLSDGRIIIYPLHGMSWIIDAPLEKKLDFTVTEWEIYWNQIDDGLTLEHILSPKPRVDFTIEKAPNWKKFHEVIANAKVEATQS